jgi:hypothetical protein
MAQIIDRNQVQSLLKGQRAHLSLQSEKRKPR